MEARLRKLKASSGSRRTVCIWEDGSGSAEREIARRLAADEANDVEFMIVSWLR